MLRRDPWVGLLVAMIVCCATFVAAQDSSTDDVEQAMAMRFTTVLERNPRRGTAFDKVYRFHLERGSLDELLKKYQEKAAASQGTAAAGSWMIAALIEAQRGHDTQAAGAFAKAEQLDFANAMASYYLGQSLVNAGQSEQAAAAFERAIQRQPATTDLLEIYQALGRVYQRSQKIDKALEVWKRLEQQFPNDVRVQEQIATTLLEENDLAAALPRFENLARNTRDKYRQSLFLIEVAEIKAKQGKTTEAIKDLEAQLAQLNPENWLFRDIRRRVENMFLKANDHAGLVTYYEKWIDKKPEDLDAVSRLARLLVSANQQKAAQTWLQRGLQVAPSNKALRQASITLFQNDGNYREVAQQYQELDKHEPNNPDTLREWGRAILKDSSRPMSERRLNAATIWKRMLVDRQRDAHAVATVAELFRRADIEDETISLYRQAIEIDPEAIQYREYLGEYLHSLKRTDEAIAIWREIAEGARKTPVNVARLAELLARYDHLSEALDVNAAACQLDPKDLHLQMKHADLLSRADRHEAALQQLAIAEKLLASDEERDIWLDKELAELKALNRLKSRTLEVRQELNGKSDAGKNPERWYWLARAYEMAGQSHEALAAVSKATELAPQSIRILSAAARLNESQRKLAVAVELYTKLAAVNRRFRTEYLKRISILEEKLGRREEALQAARDLMAASPGNPEASDFFAQLCFRMKKYDEGIQTLRRSLRANPDDLPTALKLAVVLMERHTVGEAVDLLWRALERSQNLDDRLTVVQHLADAHVRLKQLPKLYERLERESQDPARHREMTMCVARAYEAAGDMTTALSKLQSLLTDDTRDTELLNRLRTLAEAQQDFASAARFQRQIWQITANKLDRYHLAQLLLQAGQQDEAIDLLTSDNGTRELTADMLRLIDGLSRRGRQSEVLGRLKRLREQFPDNWELLYREGMVLARTSPAAAVERFESILELNRPEDEQSLLGIQRRQTVTTAQLPLSDRVSDITTILRVINSPLDARSTGLPQQRAVAQPVMWIPHDYGAVRAAAWCWLMSLKNWNADQVFNQYPETQRPVTRQNYVDRIVILSCGGNIDDKCEAARRLVHLTEDDIDAKVLYLKCIADRNGVVMTFANGQLRQTKNTSAPLKPEALEEMLAAYREVAARDDLVPLNVTLLPRLLTEFSAAGQETVAQQLMADAITKATTTTEVAYLMIYNQQTLDLASTSRLLDRLLEIPESPASSTNPRGLNPAITQIVSAEQLPRYLLPALQRSSRGDEMLAVWSRYLRLRAREAAIRVNTPVNIVALQTRPARTIAGQPTTLPAGNIQVNRLNNTVQTTRVVNGTTIVSQTALPNQPNPDMPGILYGVDVMSMLEVIRRHFEFSQDGKKIVEAFEKELTAEQTTQDERLLWQHAIAYVQWMNGNRDAALDLLAEAAKQSSRDDLSLRLAFQYELATQPAKALAVIDSLGETVIGGPFRRAMVLRLAIAAKQTDRARKEAESQIEDPANADADLLVSQLIQLEMPETAIKFLDRLAMNRPLAVHQMQTLMDLQLGQGNFDGAAATAEKTLSYLERKVDMKVTHELRQHCYKVLHDTGRLAKMIEADEKALEAMPKSEQTIDKLITYHQAAGNQPRVDELLVRKLKLDAEKPPNRYALAIKYLETDKLAESQEQMQTLLDQDPKYFASRCRDTLLRLEGAKQLLPFTTLLGELDWGTQDKQLAELPSIIDQLRSRPSTADVADKLFLKLWESRPQLRMDLLVNFKEDRWWQLEEVRRDTTSILIPQTAPNLAQQWRLFGRVIQYGDSTDGLVTVWNRLLKSLSPQTLDGLAGDMEQALKKWPDWTAGEVELAMINLRRNHVERGRDALNRLFPAIEKELRTNTAMAWEIGQELALHKDSLDVGVKYLELAVQQAGRTDWMSASSVGRAMVAAYVQHGRQADARKLLLNHVPRPMQRDADLKSIPTTSDFAQVMCIGRKLRTLDYTLEAIDLYLLAMKRTEGMLVGGYDPRNEIHGSLINAFGELKASSLLLFLEAYDPTMNQLTVPVFVRQTDPQRGRIHSRWDSMVHSIAQDAELTKKTQAALERVNQADKVAALILSADLSFAIKDRDAAASTITKLLESLKKPKATTAVNTDQIALWLIARECLSQPALAESGKTLGQLALDASRRDRSREFEMAILREWIAIATDAGNTETATRLQQDLDKLNNP